jgi:hypothetical protein
MLLYDSGLRGGVGKHTYFGRKYAVNSFGLAVPKPKRNTVRKLPVLILFIVPWVPEPIDADAAIIAVPQLVNSLSVYWFKY